jgi:hypothetical protein
MDSMSNKIRVSKAMRPIVDQAAKEGWNISLTSNGHIRFTHPCGALVHGPSTPSDHRGLKNLKATLRREYQLNSQRSKAS